MSSVLHQIVIEATNLAPSTRNKYLRDLNAWVKFAGHDPSGWNRRRAQAFYKQLLERMKPQSANRVMASLEYATKWWAAQEENPALNFVLVQKAKPAEVETKQALTIEQARKLLDTCDVTTPTGIRDLSMIIVGLETGMRSISLRSMTVEHSFLNGDAKTGYPTARVLMKGRGNERVAVPISDAAIATINRWYQWMEESRARPKGPVFRPLVKTGEGHVTSPTPLGSSSIHKIISERGKLAGIDLSPHVFRHTYVTWRLEAKFSPIEIASVTAHQLRELGALGEYADPIALGRKMRDSTPAWLASYVRARL